MGLTVFARQNSITSVTNSEDSPDKTTLDGFPQQTLPTMLRLQLEQLREEALSRYPIHLTQKRKREMDWETKKQLNTYLVCKSSLCRQDSSNLTV